MKHASEMTTEERAEKLAAGLKAAAMKARLVDLDWLKIVDASSLTLDAYGAVTGANELVAKLKADKPHLFGKHARDMSPAEQETFWREARRVPPPEPMPTDRKARDMSEKEREAWLREHSRRWG